MAYRTNRPLDLRYCGSSITPPAGTQALRIKGADGLRGDLFAAAPAPAPAPKPGPGRRAPTRETSPRPADARPATRNRAERTVDGVRELWCTGHEGHPAHWAPEHDFAVRADRPHLRYTYCDDGRRAYNRARLVTVKVRDDLGRIGIRLVVEPGSTLVGVLCAGCGQPIVEHDVVEGDSTVYHSTCKPADEAKP